MSAVATMTYTQVSNPFTCKSYGQPIVCPFDTFYWIIGNVCSNLCVLNRLHVTCNFVDYRANLEPKHILKIFVIGLSLQLASRNSPQHVESCPWEAKGSLQCASSITMQKRSVGRFTLDQKDSSTYQDGPPQDIQGWHYFE
jgi:hypothetical protein